MWPGTFAEAHFELPPNPAIYHIPASTLLFRQNGMKVATVGAGDKVILRSITIGRDLGNEIEVTEGLDPTDRVINSPSDSLAEGDLVKLADSAGAGGGKPVAEADQ